MLSIIIVNYKSEKNLARCIKSIRKKFFDIDNEIIVVNNDENLNNFIVPENIRWIDSGKNIGFGAACNLGVKQAKGAVVCFLNPDTEIISENFSELLNKLNNGNVAAIGPRLLTENGKTQKWCAGKDLSLCQIIKNNIGLIESKKVWESRKEISADWVSGAALFIKKEIFRKVAGFDEKFFLYFEDVDLCRRIKKLGYRILYSPEFSIYHKGGKSRDNFLKQKSQFFKSMLVYFIKR